MTVPALRGTSANLGAKGARIPWHPFGQGVVSGGAQVDRISPGAPDFLNSDQELDMLMAHGVCLFSVDRRRTG
jgi:hypothetical protein